MRGAETIVWPGGEHPFRLGIGELRAIEQRSDAGSAVILMRLLSGTWKIDDVYNVLRVGLIGGGASEKEAQDTVNKALEVASPYTLAVTAADVVQRFVMWTNEDTPSGEAKAAAPETESRR